MPKPLAEPVDVGMLSAQGAEFERDYALADLERLATSLAGTAGRAHAVLRFHRLSDVPALEGSVTATVRLICQRCLQAFGWPVASEFKLAFVADEAHEAGLPPDYDAVLLGYERPSLRDMVEDELLLALPLVPMHPRREDCGPLGQSAASEERLVSAEDVRQPFAVLKDLLSK